MQLSIQTVAFALAAVVTAVSATPVEDWKTAVGWDGTVLPSSAIGTAVSNDTHALEKRAVGGVYICTDINWGGTCGYAVQPVNECIVLGSDWNKQISSFGPDKCTYCEAFERGDCSNAGGSGFWDFRWPGDPTGGLGTDHVWNDRISSFVCIYSEVEC